MTRKEIREIINLPSSSLSDWSKRDDENWRKQLYILLKNITAQEANRLINMGDLEKMTLEEMDSKIHLFMEIKETE